MLQIAIENSFMINTLSIPLNENIGKIVWNISSSDIHAIFIDF